MIKPVKQLLQEHLETINRRIDSVLQEYRSESNNVKNLNYYLNRDLTYLANQQRCVKEAIDSLYAYDSQGNPKQI